MKKNFVNRIFIENSMIDGRKIDINKKNCGMIYDKKDTVAIFTTENCDSIIEFTIYKMNFTQAVLHEYFKHYSYLKLGKAILSLPSSLLSSSSGFSHCWAYV